MDLRGTGFSNGLLGRSGSGRVPTVLNFMYETHKPKTRKPRYTRAEFNIHELYFIDVNGTV